MFKHATLKRQEASFPAGETPPRTNLASAAQTPQATQPLTRCFIFDRQQLIQDQEKELEAINERDQRIQKIETDILDVNEIFRDLAVIIQEQGETIGKII